MKRVKELRDLVIDEVSLVDKGANQHATVTIAKRDGEQEEKDMDLFDEAGQPVDPASLAEGQVVFDENGQAYEFTTEPEDSEDDESEEIENEDETEEEPALVGKSFGDKPNAFKEKAKQKGKGGKDVPDFLKDKVGKSLSESVREELSKALTDADRDAVISKALGQVDYFAEVAKRAEAAAESERQLRLEREYTEVAKSYNVPVDPETLGGVLMRAAEALSYEDCAVIAKCLDAAGEGLFEEYGHRGGGANNDILTQVDALVGEKVAKSAGSREEAIVDVFATNPDAYAEYLANRGL